jgi:hypothetical protein
MKFMTSLMWTITILGFIATITGSILAIATYISPSWRLKFYIKKTKNWRKIYIGRIEHEWQYKNHPEFSIEIENESREWQTTESWMRSYPDPSKYATLVKVKVNGQVLYTEEFISLDGGRYFVPVPKRRIVGETEANNIYWYTPLQVNLSRIVGTYYRSDSIEDFMSNHNLDIKSDEDYI